MKNKNIHLLPTDKPSRLFKDDFGGLFYSINIDQEQNHFEPQHIYITNDEEIKEGDWVLGDYPNNPIGKVISKYGEEFTIQSLNGDKHGLAQYDSKKIIITTDQDLIKDGVQAIDDEFLEWFVNNPSCDEVDVDKNWNYPLDKSWEYKIIIPKEEHIYMLKGGSNAVFSSSTSITFSTKQETLEEAALEYASEKLKRIIIPYQEFNANVAEYVCFVNGAKWQAERMYSEEEVERIANDAYNVGKHGGINETYYDFKEWFKQFKKK